MEQVQNLINKHASLSTKQYVLIGGGALAVSAVALYAYKKAHKSDQPTDISQQQDCTAIDALDFEPNTAVENLVDATPMSKQKPNAAKA